MKQTAVQQLEEYLTISLGKDRMRMLANEFEKAKAMEREQIMDAVYYAMGTNFDPNMGRAELYYNTTFKSE